MRYTFIFFVLTFLSFQGFSQSKFYKNELGFRSDNDAYLGVKQDRYYTNGLFIHFRSAIENKKDTTIKKIWSANIGQEIYNPRTGQIKNIESIDRPFAGYLYGGASLQWLKQNENSLKLEIQVGTVGPSSLAEKGQTLLHDIFGFYEILGWEYQVNNELGFNATANLNYLLFRNKQKNLDFSLPINLRLGNTFTNADAGVLIRTGSLNPFTHSAATQSNISTKTERGLKKQELYLFLKPSITYVAYDATIQGGLFIDDKGPIVFKPKPFVFTQQIGATYANDRWTFDLSVIFKSKQLSEARKSEQYGSAQIYYRF